MSTYSNTMHRTQPDNAFAFSIARDALSGRSKVEIPCPLCSHLHNNSKRRCCGLKWSDENPGCIVFYCQRCNENGLLIPESGTRPIDQEERQRLERERWEKDRRKLISDEERILNLWWGQAKPFEGSPAEAYLMGRHLPVPEQHRNQMGYMPTHHFKTDTIDIWKPALVMPMRNVFAPRRLIGMHRIALDVSRETDRVRVFRTENGSLKLSMGTCGGRSALMLGWPHDGELAVCEGLETALGVLALGLWTGPIWAFTGSTHLGAFRVLPEVKKLQIFADHDKLARNGRRAGSDDALVLRNRYREAGREAHATMPAEEGMDYADMAAGNCGWKQYTILNKGEQP